MIVRAAVNYPARICVYQTNEGIIWWHPENRRRTVTRFGEPVAEVVPPSQEERTRDWLGSMKDKIEIVGDIISPANDPDDWEVLRD